MNGKIIEGKYYEQELLKPEFNFESNNKVSVSLNIDLRSATKEIVSYCKKHKDDKK